MKGHVLLFFVSVVAFLLSTCVRAETIAPSTVWESSTSSCTGQKFSTRKGVTQCVAALGNGVFCSNTFGSHIGPAFTQVTGIVDASFYSDCVFSDGYLLSHTLVNVAAGSSAGCPSNYVMIAATALCSNVNVVAAPANPGDCKPGVTQAMQIPDTGQTIATLPADVGYGGCKFYVDIATKGTVDGQPVWYLVATSSGDVSAATTGSASKPGVAECVAGKIINTTSGVVTCVDGTPDNPAVTFVRGTDADGNPTLTGDTCVGAGCLRGVQTTISGVSTTVTGTAPSGVGQKIDFPTDLAKDATVGGLGTKLDSIGAGMGSAVASLDTMTGLLSGVDTTGLSQNTLSSVGELSAVTMDNSTFANLRAWVMPTRSAPCPTWGIDLTSFHAGWNFTMDAQCTLWNSGTVAADVQAIALLAWALIALLIVLGA